MTNEEAKKVLLRMGARISDKELDVQSYDPDGYGSVRVNDYTAMLNGEFSADDLEAMVMWMNDTKGVASAEIESDEAGCTCVREETCAMCPPGRLA